MKLAYGLVISIVIIAACFLVGNGLATPGLRTGAIGFIAFCLVGAAIYVWNNRRIARNQQRRERGR